MVYHYTILHIFYKCSILPNDSIQSSGQADTKFFLIWCKGRQSKNTLLISSYRVEKVLKFKTHYISCDGITGREKVMNTYMPL